MEITTSYAPKEYVEKISEEEELVYVFHSKDSMVFVGTNGKKLSEVLDEFEEWQIEQDVKIQLALDEIEVVRDSLWTGITANPFIITFGDSIGWTMIRGVWNQPMARIEC